MMTPEEPSEMSECQLHREAFQDENTNQLT